MAAAIRGFGFTTLDLQFERSYKLLNGCITAPFPASSLDCSRRLKSLLGIDAQPGKSRRSPRKRPDDERRRPLAVAREVRDDRNADQSAAITAGIEHALWRDMLSARATNMSRPKMVPRTAPDPVRKGKPRRLRRRGCSIDRGEQKKAGAGNAPSARA